VFKMEEPRSSKGKLRDQTTKETKEGKFSSFLNWLDLSGSSVQGASVPLGESIPPKMLASVEFSKHQVLESRTPGASSRVLTTNDPSWRAGGTTLQGHSYQLFQPTNDPITADPSKKVELVLRLVAREDEPDVKFPTDPCNPLSTLRPPPVPE